MKALLVQFLRTLAPIIGVIGLFQVVVPGQPIPDLLDLLWGTALVVLGLSLFVQGLKLGLFPLGETMAWDFARKGSLMWLFLFVFALGVNVYEIMAKPVISVSPDMDIRYCARLFGRFLLTRAPVLENGEVAGIVSMTDLVIKGMLPYL